MNKGIEIGGNCPICGKYSEKMLNVTREQMKKILQWRRFDTEYLSRFKCKRKRISKEWIL